MKIEGNKEQEHKAIANTRYLFRGSSHRSTPRLHRREGFPLSTEDVTRSTKDRSTELHHLQNLHRRGVSTRTRRSNK